ICLGGHAAHGADIHCQQLQPGARAHCSPRARRHGRNHAVAGRAPFVQSGGGHFQGTRCAGAELRRRSVRPVRLLSFRRRCGAGASVHFTEDPHNSFLNAFISGGWLAGFGYFALSLVTVAASTRFLFVRTPWQSIYHVLYAAYIATLAESMIIDIDHWRHYFLILGLLWGLMAASRTYRSSARMVLML